jgi:hypothetical protein
VTDQLNLVFDEQQANLERVSSRIALAILRFCGAHKFFHADDLRKAVIRETGIAAPASADRILRHLRQRGKLDYRVLDRRASYYEVLWVGKPASQPKEAA